MNSFLLALAALLILVLSALFAAPLFIDWNDYRPAFETQATKLLGREVKVGGKVHLILLPAPELRFDDIKVADETGSLDRPLLEARTFEAWLNIGALLSGTFEARKISIVDPVLRLDVREDGTGNWRGVGRKGVALPFAPKEVMLDSISVTGGRIEITKNGAQRLVLEDIVGEASAASLSGPYKVTATYSFDGRTQELRLSTSEPDAAGLFRVKSALRDPERDTTYLFDGDVTGLSATPSYDGNIVVRVANAPEGAETGGEPETGTEPHTAALPADTASFFELKGPLKATPDRAELPDFDLTVHAKGRPQIMKGRLTLDFADAVKADGALEARWIDLDAWFGGGDAGDSHSPAEALYLVADELLSDAARFGDARLAVSVEQAGLGGDLVGDLDVALASSGGSVRIERLTATLPGKNRIEVTGALTHGTFGPVFAGPVKLDGADVRALSRWGAGDRDVSAQAAMGTFTLKADAKVGDGELTLANVQGEVSDTTFRGALSLKGGERNVIEISLDSDKLDLRELLGDGPIWQSWFPAKTASKDGTAPAGEANLLASLRNDDIRVTLHVGELLMPNIPAGRLDAGFTLIGDTFDLQKLDFAAADVVALSGKGHVERVSQAPSGGVDFGLKATTADSLRIVAKLFGFPESVSQSKHLVSLAPLDIHVGLVAAKEGEGTKASIDLDGKAGGSDVSLIGRAVGDTTKLSEAMIELDGSVTGDRPQALLVLLFPDLPAERLAVASGGPGKLALQVEGVPKTKMAGKASLDTATMKLTLVGQGALDQAGTSFNGKVSLTSRDASLALMLLGFEAPPSSAGIPLSLQADIVKQVASIDLAAVGGTVAGQPVAGSAHFDTSGSKTRFSIGARSDYVSLPSLLGTLIAWQRTPSTEELLGAIGSGASTVWPARGFSLGVLDKAEGDITLTAKTLSLGAPFQVSGATLAASIDKKGLNVRSLSGRLFGGNFAATGGLWPRGTGAELEAKAELKGGKLEEASEALVGSELAKGLFNFAVSVQGEGLSPPGLVAGLSGEGALSLGAGSLQALSAEPLRKVALTAKKGVKADKEEIAQDARTVRETLTKGVYRYPPAAFAFEVKNGTVRLVPATLSTAGAAAKIDFYLELASLKVDSEWAMSLTGADDKDMPPVTLVFAGALDKANEIAPRIDTAAIEEYLTVHRMQEDVERLETLDVSGRTQAPAAAEPEAPVIEPEAETLPVPETSEPPALPAGLDTLPPAGTALPPAQPAEAAPAEGTKPRAETVVPDTPALQSAPSGPAAAPSIDAMRMPVPNNAGAGESALLPTSTSPEKPASPSAEAATPQAALPAEETAAPQPAPEAALPPDQAPPPPAASETLPWQQSAPAQAPPAQETTTSEAEEGTPAPVEAAPQAHRRSASKSRRTIRQEARDAWKKGIGIFGF